MGLEKIGIYVYFLEYIAGSFRTLAKEAAMVSMRRCGRYIGFHKKSSLNENARTSGTGVCFLSRRYINGSSLRTGWSFSVRKAIKASGSSSVTLSSAILSVYPSMP